MKLKASAIIILIIIALGAKKMTQKTTPRGIRNNNAGNIRKNGINWNGASMVQRDPAFVQFASPDYGIRALAIILQNYQKKYGLNTIRGIISRWAPASENNTNAYIDAVSKQAGISADAPLDLTRRAALLPLVEAIIMHENGQQPYSIAMLNNSLSMAGVA